MRISSTKCTKLLTFAPMFFENFPEVKSTGRTGPARDFSARAGVYPEGSKIEAESGGGFLGAVSPAVRA